jgi:prolyl-tRNA editing enzyme YbaK/EbsC (Cys-tRNA(Pro) deacylase)
VDDIERRVREIVAGIPGADVMDCDPALADTADFCAAYGIAMEDSANAIMVIGKASSAAVPPVYAVCLVLATTRLDVNRVVRKRLGTKKASFAPPDVTAEHTGMTMGGVTPFGLPADLPLWIDSRVMARERVVVGGGSRSAKVIGPPSMLLTIPTAEVVDDLAQPVEG